jgi:adenine-specific DNA-methyltransferase
MEHSVRTRTTQRRVTVRENWRSNNHFTLVRGNCAELLKKLPQRSVDLVLTSPPYCIGKSYEKETNAKDFAPNLKKILPDLIRVLRVGGSICWQVGYHVDDRTVTPLDVLIYNMMAEYPVMRLRNRIIWMFGHGLHSEDRFSGRHEMILWFTKGKRYRFNLDAVRVLQKYPGKRHYKGSKYGKLSGNPKGKNPADVWDNGDIWDIPNVKANHVEKTAHPCQFPVSLARRIIAATTKKGALVLDPFAGAGTTGVAAALLDRRFVGTEINRKYHQIALHRISQALTDKLLYRPDWARVYQPKADTPLTAIPKNWRIGSTSSPLNNGASARNGAQS